ncbi:MAG: TonB-dependent receptor [Sulfuricurvum sp.]|nr:TonB-dependent receptor [Sulfuricurvum sp.]MDD2785125.1 TonB-dependent receptor [Sulfuricurvum sp.]
MRKLYVSIILANVLYSVSVYAGGEQSIHDLVLPKITVKAQTIDFVETDASSEGTVTAEQLSNRPILRPAEVLETVPGLIVTQHSGDGKANQYFLRGFSLDHGTDFYTTLNGMPTNLPTHAHGQGYNDLNFLIPELISEITYKKGPYYAEEGDFASTGSAHINYADAMDQGIASLSLGSFGHKRLLNADSFELKGGTLLYGMEYFYNDGPWEHPERYKRFNGIVSYTKEEGRNRYKVTAMGYKGDWDATNHVPVRAIDSGVIGRYGSLDPSDGGITHRYSLSGEFERHDNRVTTKANAYIIDYGLDLFSNFTYFLNDPVNGDQFQQKESRIIAGGNIGQVRVGSIFGMDSIASYGLQVRHDSVDVALNHTKSRSWLNTMTSDKVKITTAALYYQNELSLSDKVRMIPGIRFDTYCFNVESDVNSANSATKYASIASPKLNFIFGPWEETQFFLNGGYGFHSNDARGISASSNPATPLVRTKGAEIGIQNRSITGLETSLAFWMMDSDSELVFAGDTGGTEPTGKSRRQGIEWANYWTPSDWFILDADVAVSQARYKYPDITGGKYVPEAIEKVVSVGISINDYNDWFGGMRLRYFGSRALIEDNSVRSEPSTLVNLKAG